jgi:hypothetical protein
MIRSTIVTLLLSAAAAAQLPPPSTPPLYTTWGPLPMGAFSTFCEKWQPGGITPEAQVLDVYQKDGDVSDVLYTPPGPLDRVSVSTWCDQYDAGEGYPVVFIVRLHRPRWLGVSTFACDYWLTQQSTVPGARLDWDQTWADPWYPDFVTLMPTHESYPTASPKKYWLWFEPQVAWRNLVADVQAVRLDLDDGLLYLSDFKGQYVQ